MVCIGKFCRIIINLTPTVLLTYTAPRYKYDLFVSSILYPVSSVLYPVSCIQYPVSSIQYPVSCILYPVSSILYPVSSALYPISLSSIKTKKVESTICQPVFKSINCINKSRNTICIFYSKSKDDKNTDENKMSKQIEINGCSLSTHGKNKLYIYALASTGSFYNNQNFFYNVLVQTLLWQSYYSGKERILLKKLVLKLLVE